MVWFWAVLTAVLVVIEAVTVQLVTIWFAVGALSAVVANLLGADIVWQFVIFTAVSLIMLILTRPYVKKFVERRTVPTNADRVIGCDAVTQEEINNKMGTGQVKVGGVIWTARSINDEVIEKDTLVVVEKIEGVKVIVSKKIDN